MLIVLLVTMLAFVPAFIQWHGRWLQRLEDPATNGYWVIGYDVWKPGYVASGDFEAWNNRVLHNDLATVTSHDLAGAERRTKELLKGEYPLSKRYQVRLL